MRRRAALGSLLLDYQLLEILAEIDRSITPFREHKRDLKESYKTNNWLSKEEMTDIAQAYRSMKGDQDINKIADYVKLFKDNNLKTG